jgi:2-C-methyl-D-erythritol 4-phosphate cytidylyltransferase
VAVALLVAAGRGERLGSAGPKAFVPCAGRPLVEWSVEALRACAAVERIVVALPPGVVAPAGTEGVPGGRERSHSVRAALQRAGDAEVVVVHDAARPLVTPAIVEECLETLAAEDCDGAIAAAPVADTIKEAEGTVVVRTLDRARLWAVQTPQVFRRAVLERAMDAAREALAAATDDAALVERAGGEIRLVAAPRDNLKVTTAGDLRLAELLLRDRAAR